MCVKVKYAVKNSLKYVMGAIFSHKLNFKIRYFRNRFNGKLDKEMFFVDKLLDNRRRFVDVGGNVGFYSYHFKNRFSSIEVFEPVCEVIEGLKLAKFKNIKVHNCALSNVNGRNMLRIPLVDGKRIISRSSLEHTESECKTIEVEVLRLDHFNFLDVDLIKIDVEGHEYNVIDGATETIIRCMPLLIVEIEQRHMKQEMEVVFEKVLSLGYAGYFMYDNKLVELKEFSYEHHQKPYLEDVLQDNYVNNFIFVPASRNLT